LKAEIFPALLAKLARIKTKEIPSRRRAKSVLQEDMAEGLELHL
jgi:hypothetical protein